MKRTIPPSLFLALMLITSWVSAQITGQLPEKPESPWTLKNIEGVDIPITGDAKGHFVVAVSKLKKGFYQLGDIGTIYLEPDYAIAISGRPHHYVFSGKGSRENNLIQQSLLPLSHIQSDGGYGMPLAVFLMEPKIFLPVVDGYLENADSLFNTSDNRFFVELSKKDSKFVRRNMIYNYLLFYGMDSTKMEPLRQLLKIPLAERKPDHSKLLYKAYLSQFSKKLSPEEKTEMNNLLYENWDINDETLFKNSDSYRFLVKKRIEFLAKSDAYKKLTDSLKSENKVKLLIIDKEIANPYINDYQNYIFTYAMIKSAKTTAEVEADYQQYIVRSNNPTRKNEIQTVYNNLKGTQKNTPAPEFNYTDPNGKLVSLKSLRGKYVYIDIWATWCAPCIAEIPGLKKLGEAYAKNNIQFVSLSVDTQANKEKWQAFVKDNQLEGIQLMADLDFNSDFIKKFGVTSIPRFLLIGPEGEIIENDAKRPTDTELKKQLDQLLLASKN
jgi:thiol-disulfide isomerase/thioredoxin